MARTLSLICIFAAFIVLGQAQAQDAPPTQAHAPGSTPAEAGGVAGGVSASQLANANNPLADMNAFNFQNYYSPTLYGVPNSVSNTLDLRPVVVSGRQIIRVTLPVTTVPTGSGNYQSGLGDFKGILSPQFPVEQFE